MGEDWVCANLVNKHGVPDYFRASAESEERYKNSVRVITFAEMLFNLQDVEGISSRHLKLRQLDCESAVAELQGAAILHATGFTIRFREEGYDLDVLHSSGDVAVEIKRKLESTEPSSETVKDTLEGARKQLPRDRPGIVFLNIPESWVNHPQAGEILKNGLEAFFRNTGRIEAVVLWWEDFVQSGGGWWRSTHLREEKNTNTRFPAGPVRELAELTHQAKRPWT